MANCQVPQEHIPRKSYALFESRAILKEVFANLRVSS
jgi:hypothetical protein